MILVANSNVGLLKEDHIDHGKVLRRIKQGAMEFNFL